MLNFRRVELLREIMVRNGDGPAVWFNEYGGGASPDLYLRRRRLLAARHAQAAGGLDGSGDRVRAQELALGGSDFHLVPAAGGRHTP